ncbi:RHS repeat-associated core domain-containing protein [Stenotrophomonas sp. SORGH_AS_0321]|uniref:RHS repeat-associated core domain-containing protein n=1 Tax=Stenotrophomonas sp. SORGH_AS_0321 TaxID=3041787 RepID=UPI0028552638|nr:RHS repeat-associated core domain-containing protein [Stenotrophomonas sp. SORGH_AS_0321]MDR6095685.1 RHS repeat-associated protein [Stenotrophomonas sp. SORGH_AS_0321]
MKIFKWLVSAALMAASAVGGAQTHETVRYIHTDALGSPVAISDSAGTVVERFDYEPYGAAIGQGRAEQPSYTGHVADSATGLLYMQQRYYDPELGVFISTDPIGVDGTAAGNFCRYCYAANSPYAFTDPDGRLADTLVDIGLLAYDAYKIAREGATPENMAALAADAAATAVPFVTGAGVVVRAGSQATTASRRAETLAKNVQAGAGAEQKTSAKYGKRVAGTQVTFVTSTGMRPRVDFVLKEWPLRLVESKAGDARLSPAQRSLQADVAAGRAVTPVGRNAEKAGLKPGEKVTPRFFTLERWK